MAIWKDCINEGSHKKYVMDIPLEQVDPSWATQVCTYGWGMGIPFGTAFPGYIDMLAIRPTGIRVARYRGMITPEFQKIVGENYLKMWTAIQNNSYVLSLGENRLTVEYLAQFERWY